MKKQELLEWLAFYTLFPVMIASFTPALSLTKIYNISIADLVITFFVPLYFMIVYPKLFFALKEAPTQNEILLFIMFMVIFSIGWGMHASMNTVSSFSFGGKIPKIDDIEVHEMIWFYDEIMGHLLIYLGYYGLMLSFCHHEKQSLELMTKNETLLFIFFGAFWGAGMVAGVIESGFTLFVLVINTISIIYILQSWEKSEEKLRTYLQKRPFTLFYLIQTLTLMPFLIVYYAVFGLIQPSEVLQIMLK